MKPDETVSRTPPWANTSPGLRFSDAGRDDVGNVRAIGRRVDAQLNRVQLDGKFVAQQPGKVIRIDIVRRVDAVGLHVLAVFIAEIVVDGQEQAVRACRVEQRPHRSLVGGFGQRRVLHRHQVE
jgi:hypothetical protein